MYLTQDGSSPSLVGMFALPQVGWSPSTQVDIDAYQLNQAQYGETGKVVELKTDLQSWRDSGYLYSGATYNLSPNSALNLNWKNGLTPNNVNPWETAVTYPLDALVIGTDSVIYKSLIVSNIGNNPVPTPGSNWSVFSDIPDRYKYFDQTYIQRDRSDTAGFTLFAEAFLKEEDRIMVLYNNYRLQIADCTTVAEVDAITITFSP